MPSLRRPMEKQLNRRPHSTALPSLPLLLFPPLAGAMGAALLTNCTLLFYFSFFFPSLERSITSEDLSSILSLQFTPSSSPPRPLAHECCCSLPRYRDRRRRRRRSRTIPRRCLRRWLQPRGACARKLEEAAAAAVAVVGEEILSRRLANLRQRRLRSRGMYLANLCQGSMTVSLA